jgi:signal transduction histidine kinase/CheY-like chemotaxis protein
MASIARDFSKVFVPIAVAVIGVATLLGLVSIRAATDARIAQDQAATRVAAASILDAIEPVRQHLRAVSRETLLREALDDPSPRRLKDVAGTSFSTLLRRNLDYAKVRWIDQSGRERVRVNAGDPDPERVPEEHLQDMKPQYFVSQALNLATDAIYQSAFDLNIENGSIELPPRPTLRIAIKLADSAGKAAGLLMINVDGKALLRRLTEADARELKDQRGGLELVDASGFWLHGQPGTDEFAFMYGRPASLAAERGGVWQEMYRNSNGGVSAPDGIWAWSIVDPTPELGSSERANRTPWFVVDHDQGVELGRARWRLAAGYGGMAVLMLGLTALLSLRLARERELLLEAKAAAESAARAKVEFLANMSHEIRTPMNAILGHARLLRRDPCSPEQAPRIARINEAGDHLLMLLNDILDMSKLDAGGMRLESVDFSVAALLDSVSSFVLPGARAKGLTVVVDVGDVPDWLEGDPTRLRQALVNYASNALKFTEHGGIEFRCKTEVRTSDDIVVRFQVLDTGIGIAPEALPRLFRIFEQAERSTTRRFGGTGLGLAITKRLAEMMGGSAGLESQVGRGSTFWFSAKLRLGHAPTVQRAAIGSVERALRSNFAGRRVLLAEDNQVNRELAAEFLERAGLSVTTALDGEDAVQKAAEGTFDLVLLDMQMPRVDGLEAARRLRRMRGYEALPILALTANAFHADREACVAAGMNDFISKPVDADALYAHMLRWLPDGEVTSPPGMAPSEAAPLDRDERPHHIAGVDLDEARRILGTDEGLFRKIVQSFIESKRTAPRELREAAAAGDFLVAGELAHRIFGSAGAIGATAVAKHSQAIDHAVRLNRAGAETLVGTRALADELDGLIEALQSWFLRDSADPAKTTASLHGGS